MEKLKKHRGLERLKARYGTLFITPWLVGVLLFFVWPIAHSLWPTFSDLTIAADGIHTSFVGLTHYREMLVENPDYVDNVAAALTDLLVSIPFILIVSMVLALLLNGKFKGRIFFRGLYFIPVIFVSGVVLELFLRAGASEATATVTSEAAAFGMPDMNEMFEGLNLPQSISGYISSALSNIFLLVWQSGIQTVLIIAGLQSVPSQHYEVARVEGANAWQTFWFVTFPQLTRTLLLALVFTVVDLSASDTNSIVAVGYNEFEQVHYGLGSAMLWFYYLFIGLLLAAVFLLWQKAFLKKWGDAQ